MKRQFSYEAPTPPLELRDEMEQAATASVAYYILLALSACLATLGLIADSTAVIIGAMIIAPLMNPIIAHSFSLARSNRNIWLKSTISMATGILLVLLISYGVARLVGFSLQGKEILSRGNPNLIDLGVAIASGIAGAIAWSRKRIANALPGVAIAVALVPPLCTAGIALAMGDNAMRDPNQSNLEKVDNVAKGALLLFFTNFAAILVFGAIVFFVQGYGKLRKASVAFFVPLMLIVALAFPLARKFNQQSARGKTMQILKELAEKHPDWSEASLNRLRVEETAERISVRMRLMAPAGVIDGTDLEIIREALADSFERPVDVQIYRLEFELVTTEEGE